MASETKKARKSLNAAEEANDLSRAHIMQAATHAGWGYEIPEYKEIMSLCLRIDDLIDKLRDMVTQVDA